MNGLHILTNLFTLLQTDFVRPLNFIYAHKAPNSRQIDRKQNIWPYVSQHSDILTVLFQMLFTAVIFSCLLALSGKSLLMLNSLKITPKIRKEDLTRQNV